MKVKLIKALPWFGVGHVFETEPNGETKWYPTYSTTQLILGWWAEEVVEAAKSVWDLKIGNEYVMLGTDGYETTNIWREALVETIRRECHNVFLTPEDADMELLRRESRAKAWKPMKEEYYFSVKWDHSNVYVWVGDAMDMMNFHNGNVHKTKEEATEWSKTYGKAFWLI